VAGEPRPVLAKIEEVFMLNKNISLLLSAVLLLGSVPRMASAAWQTSSQLSTSAQIKSKVLKLGVGEKAKATATLKDGTKIKGYIAGSSAEDFVIRDRHTDAATTLRYDDVKKLESNRGHSTAKHLGIGIGIGAGALIGILLIIFASLDD